MSDPAIIAAEKAYGRMGAEHTIWDEAVTAAREMAKPIRELHRPMTPSELADAGLSRHWRKCVECSSGYYWNDFPCETAKHIYTTEELER